MYSRTNSQTQERQLCKGENKRKGGMTELCLQCDIEIDMPPTFTKQNLQSQTLK